MGTKFVGEETRMTTMELLSGARRPSGKLASLSTGGEEMSSAGQL